MWFIRRMLRISWTEKKPNVNVLREGNVQRSLLNSIRKRQMEILGHVCRRRGLEFLSLTGKEEGKRDRGQQRITFLDSLCNSATGGQSKGLNFLKLSDDRNVWRGMAANVCSRFSTWWWWWWMKDNIYINYSIHKTADRELLLLGLMVTASVVFSTGEMISAINRTFLDGQWINENGFVYLLFLKMLTDKARYSKFWFGGDDSSFYRP